MAVRRYDDRLIGEIEEILWLGAEGHVTVSVSSHLVYGGPYAGPPEPDLNPEPPTVWSATRGAVLAVRSLLMTRGRVLIRGFLERRGCPPQYAGEIQLAGARWDYLALGVDRLSLVEISVADENMAETLVRLGFRHVTTRALTDAEVYEDGGTDDQD